MNRYQDMLHLPHHVSATRARMSTRDRAAQFAPFAALTGYDAVIREADRVTDGEVTLTESAEEELDRALRMLHDGQCATRQVRLVYFVPDLHKAGGARCSVEARVKKVDPQRQVLTLEGGEEIPLAQLLELHFLDHREKM